MYQALPHIRKSRLHELQQTIARIARTTDCEMVICYGVRSQVPRAWTCFLPQQRNHSLVYYDLLVITAAAGKAGRVAVAQQFQHQPLCSSTFVAVAHSMKAVNTGLQNGNYFFTHICTKGVVLYDRGRFALSLPHRTMRPQLAPAHMEAQWAHSYAQACHFIEGAFHFVSRQWYGHALFMLHQSIEHACNGLIAIHLGYRPGVHNLGRLLAMVDNFANGTVWFRAGGQQKVLFALLEKAYVQARYSSTFAVSATDAALLLQQADDFLRWAQARYEDKRSSLAPPLARSAVA